jgi:hypothetical protein
VREDEASCPRRRRVGYQTGRTYAGSRRKRPTGASFAASHLPARNPEAFQSNPTVTHNDGCGGEVRRGNRASGVEPFGSSKDHAHSQVRLSGLSRNRRVCSADNERHSLSIRARCSFFVASVPVRVGRKDLWACSKLKSSTHLQRSRCPALPKRKPLAEGAHWKALTGRRSLEGAHWKALTGRRSLEGAHWKAPTAASLDFISVACAAAAWLPVRRPVRADRRAPGCNNRAAGTPRARRRFPTRATPGRCR